MTVEPARFAAAMSEHWQTTLNNVSSPRLEAVWQTMAETFNAHISNHGDPDATQWKVLKPETGTGKTQGLSVYCSLLPQENHPGVLIVTRMKVQADEIVETINNLSGQQIALAYHGDNRVPVADLMSFPVLVITHRAYEIGLDAVNKDQPNSWEHLHAWGLEGRKLVVIDEALDIVDHAQVTLDEVELILGVIPASIKSKHPSEIEAIMFLRDLLMQINGQVKESNQRDRALWSGAAPLPVNWEMTSLRKSLRDVRFDQKILHKEDAMENARITQRLDKTLRDIQAVLENWNWYSKKQGNHTINSARLIVPEDIEGAVILDATASSNLTYEAFDKAQVINTLSARNYSSVTLHVSLGHKVGKVSMTKHATKEAPRLFDNLTKVLSQDRRVLAVCHKNVEPHLVQYQGTHFDAYDVGHWGALDGRNTWQDYDAVVIFGLPYRDSIWSANTFMALQGPQTTEWLNSDGDRPFQQFKDIRHSMNIGQIVVQIVQASNRIRSRRVIDIHGNCPPCDVFLLLPSGKMGEELLSGIMKEMPGINVREWDYAECKRKPRKSGHEEALVRYAGNMKRGRKVASSVRSELGISGSTWDRMVVKMGDQSSDLTIRLKASGVTYEVERTGKTTKGYLIKEAA